MSFNIGDIIFFDSYHFTDTPDGNVRPHYAFILIPTDLSAQKGQIYCAVVTSNRPTDTFYLELKQEKYTFLQKDSFICFLRQDFQSITDVTRKFPQPVGTIDQEDIKKCFELLKDVLYDPTCQTSKMNKFLKTVLMREWKKITT